MSGIWLARAMRKKKRKRREGTQKVAGEGNEEVERKGVQGTGYGRKTVRSGKIVERKGKKWVERAGFALHQRRHLVE